MIEWPRHGPRQRIAVALQDLHTPARDAPVGHRWPRWLPAHPPVGACRLPAYLCLTARVAPSPFRIMMQSFYQNKRVDVLFHLVYPELHTSAPETWAADNGTTPLRHFQPSASTIAACCGLDGRDDSVFAIATQTHRPALLPQADDPEDARLRAGKLVRKDRRSAQQQSEGPQPRGFA